MTIPMTKDQTDKEKGMAANANDGTGMCNNANAMDKLFSVGGDNVLPENYRHTFSTTAGPKLRAGLDVENFIKNRSTTFEVEGGNRTPFELNGDDSDDDTESEFYLSQFREMRCPERKHDLILGSVSSEEAIGNFDELVRNMKNLTGDGKVKKMILRKGTGKIIPQDGKVCIDYIAFAEGKDESFDSTLQREIAQVIQFGTTSCLLGLELGLKSMEYEEVAKFWMHYDYAFGEHGAPPRIPAAASVVFTVQLKQVFSGEDLKSCLFMTRDERNALPFEEVCKTANEVKVTGNGFYKSNSFGEAARRYRTAIDLLENYSTAKEKEDNMRNELVFTLYSNLATCLLKQSRPAEACTACKTALKLPITSTTVKNDVLPKVYYRFAEAKHKLGALDDALKLATKAQNKAQRAPQIKDIRNFICKVQKDIEAYNKEAKHVYAKMFSH